MGEKRSQDVSREERLAAKLRENLRRRKAQAREMSTDGVAEAQTSGVFKDKGKS